MQIAQGCHRIFADEFGESPGLGDQGIAPALGGVHDRSLGPMAVVIDHQHRTDRIGIDPAHEFADVLHLAPATLMRGDFSREHHRIEQRLGQGELVEPCFGQIDDGLAKQLQFVGLTLALRFAWAQRQIVVDCIRVIVAVGIVGRRFHGRAMIAGVQRTPQRPPLYSAEF